MTALYMDGFDHYGGALRTGTDNMVNGNWAQVTGQLSGGFEIKTPSWSTARTGPYCLVLESVNMQIARKILPAPQTNLYVSFAYGLDRLHSSQTRVYLIDFRNSGTGEILYSLGFNPDGQIQFWQGSQDTLIATTSGPVVRTKTWQFYEMCLNTEEGTFTLHVDDATGAGTPVLTASVATGTSIGSISLGQYGGFSSEVVNMAWDDLFIRNGSGDVNNGFMGDRRVATLFPTTDTSEADWTPSYYKEFGNGILRLSYQVPNRIDDINPTAFVSAAPATALDIGVQDFTWESMVRFDKLPSPEAYQTLFARWNASTNNRSYRFILGGSSYNNGCLQLDVSTDGTGGAVSTPILYPFVPDLDQWYHIAVCRSAGELLLFVNGEQLGLPVVDPSNWFSPSTARFVIGNETTANGGTVIAGTNFCGRLDETRFTNGVSRYTGPFAPPTEAFPIGSTDDPDWSDVVLICSYDSGIIDESSYARVLTVAGNASQQLPIDGPDVGLFSTVNKPTPDDNTFITARLTSSSNILTMTVQPADGDTVTVGTTDGTTPAVYTFKNTISVAFDVLIDTTAQDTLINLYDAINTGSGVGVKYGTGTVVNYDVTSFQLPVGQIEVVANTAGTVGNTIPSTATGTSAAWDNPTLTGGLDIPGPTSFQFQRPPNNTTIISALQTVIRASKSDSGPGTVQTAFIAPLGAVESGAPHALALNPSYYNDIIETDPDTDGPLSPTAIINGEFQITRTE